MTNAIGYKDKIKLTPEGESLGKKILEKNPWFKKRVEECLGEYNQIGLALDLRGYQLRFKKHLTEGVEDMGLELMLVKKINEHLELLK